LGDGWGVIGGWFWDGFYNVFQLFWGGVWGLLGVAGVVMGLPGVAMGLLGVARGCWGLLGVARGCYGVARVC